MNSKYRITLGIATRQGVVFRHQYILSAFTSKEAKEKALRRASRRFWRCGVVVEDWEFAR